MASKKTILIAIDSLYNGGAEVFAMRLANALEPHYNIHFAIAHYHRSVHLGSLQLLNKNIPAYKADKHFAIATIARFPVLKKILHLLNLLNKYFYWQNQFVGKSLEKYIRQHHIEIVHTHAPGVTSILSSSTHRSNFKLVTTLHGTYEILRNDWKNEDRFRKFMEAHLYALDKVAYLSSDQFLTFAEFGYPQEKMVKIFNGVDIDATGSLTTYSPPEHLKLIIVSRSIKEKGWKEAIETCRKLNADKTCVTLKLVGDGEELTPLKLTYSYLEYVSFIGHSDHPLALIAEAHIGLLPSYLMGESLPNSVIEYMSQGKPVISSNIGAIQEMMEANGELCGELIDTTKGIKLTVDQIEKAIRIYLDKPEKVESDSKKAIQAFDKFRMDTCLDAYIKWYQSTEQL